MNRIEQTFHSLKQRQEKALVGFVTAGDPDLPQSGAIIDAMLREGVDILELGVPFSDPTADGPVIQRSSARALKAGVNLKQVLVMIKDIRKRSTVPIIVFSYYNPILAYGRRRFYEDAVAAGADGILLVDLPPEEAEEMTSRWPGRDLSVIRLIAPTTPPERMAAIAADASGFLYLVSMTGVTGSGGLETGAVSETILSLKTITDLPVCVGFGVSTPAHVAALAPTADGVVVGSAFESIIETHLDHPECPQRVGEKVRELKAATRQ
jgi:tryptophan synthase alpha chain